jgi:hypothetical protein
MAASDSTTSMADILDTIPSSLDTTGIVQLMPPGPDSNYPDWSFVMTLYLRSLKLCHVIESVEPKDRPASWVGDTCAVGFLIVRTIHHSNLRFIRAHGKDAHKMWMSLKDVHEAAVSGGRLHWLQQMMLTRMTGDDIESHLDKMASYAEKLDSLVSLDKPLTTEDIHATALLISLPPDWLNSVSFLILSHQ